MNKRQKVVLSLLFSATMSNSSLHALSLKDIFPKSVRRNAAFAWQSAKEHYLATGSVVLLAGLAILYKTNQAFRQRVRELLGLETAEAFKGTIGGLEEIDYCTQGEPVPNCTREVQPKPALIINRQNILAPTADEIPVQ